MAHELLKKLYFGKDDAETDFAKGGLLRAGFLRTTAFEEALSGTKSLIIGRKGSGKSAICLMLQAALSDEKRVSLVTPDEISADEIRRFQLPGIQPSQSKQLIWRYVFNVQIAKYLLAVGKSKISQTPEESELVSALRRFLIDNNEVDDLSTVERFWRVVERLKGSISLEAFGAKIGAGVEGPSSGIRVNNSLDVVEGKLARLGELFELEAAARPFYLLVDQIEKVWSNDTDSDAMVVGVLLASKSVQSRWPWVRCSVFLRADIYEKLQFGDRDKFRGDEFHINWDKTQLLQLIEARAAASSDGQISAEALWKDVFPTAVGGQDCKTYLIGRTLMRPRDIIQLCNACRDTAKTSNHASIESQDLVQAGALYSNWKLSDLQNEWIINYPFLPDLFVLLADNSYLVTRDAFTLRLQSIAEDLVERYPAVGQLLSADALLSILYGIGFFGVVRKGTTRYSYQDKLESRIQQFDEQFSIHPCFRPALQSTSAIDLRPFERLTDSEQDIYRGRVSRGLRIGSGLENIRGSRVSTSLRDSEMKLKNLRIALSKSKIQQEALEEITGSLGAMEDELDQAANSGSTSAARISSQRVMTYLGQLEHQLRSAALVGEKDDLWYTFRETIETLERFIMYGSSRDDYIA